LTNDKKINNRLFSYENDPINEDLLNSVIRDVIVLMRDKNQPVVDVYFPEQDITDGFIVALVSRAILDKVYVNGNDYYTEEEIKEHFTLRRGDYIWSDILAKDLRWINSNPYRQVDTIFKPGEKPRTSDVILETKDIFPFRIFGGYDNYGAPATSKDQYYAGFSYGDLWGLDHEVIYSIGMGNQFNRFNTHTLQYKIPFDWRHKLSITGTLSQSEPDLGAGPITQEGENIFVNLDYEIPLYGYGLRGFTQTLRIGFDYKRLENNVDFGGATVFSSSPEIAQFYWTYEAAKTSAIARNIFSTTLYAAPGDLTANNTAEDFDLARNGASEDYVYAKAAYETSYTERNTGVSLTGIFRGQYSINKLLSSEQIAISGPGAVRGFQTNSIRRDNGFIATGELATPYMSIFDDIIQTNIGDRIQGFVFYDRGWGKNDRDQGSIDSEINLDSYGVGMRFNIGRHLSGVLEYGREVDDELNDGIDDRLHLRVNAAY
jgi:hemolysin activation/secretion protein